VFVSYHFHNGNKGFKEANTAVITKFQVLHKN